ncbi:hypothetical protein PHMEG_0006075 [Phytophthora megakarya]|uniref:Uncharacterized protein n=1 Tax=Phytophthora megakarya TaxID=4795 RepID=A0A225WPS9_9STRA|nr:hypothetical protein PHMEG_0006075 [Phytophthora megakarya]
MADIAMTGEAGANRTFRSIFGATEQRPDEVRKMEVDTDGNTSVPSQSSAAALEDDDEAMWADEPLDAAAQDNNELPGLQFAQRKSMEEWADDDDEEENWKDALQDRVNQLELAFQHDAEAVESRRQLHHLQHVDVNQSPAARFAASGADAERPRPASRHKVQRTSSSTACIPGESATSSRPNHLWNFQRKVVGPATLDPDPRRRPTPIDFVARNIHTVEHHRKRSGSVCSSSGKTDSPRHSLSRKNSMDSSRSSLSRSNSSSSIRGAKGGARAGNAASGAAVFNLSDTESIRRFVLDDVKTMSMERLVGDAQRLHFLEDFYQSHQGAVPTPSITTSTAVPPSPASSASPMSTS